MQLYLYMVLCKSQVVMLGLFLACGAKKSSYFISTPPLMLELSDMALLRILLTHFDFLPYLYTFRYVFKCHLAASHVL